MFRIIVLIPPGCMQIGDHQILYGEGVYGNDFDRGWNR